MPISLDYSCLFLVPVTRIVGDVTGTFENAWRICKLKTATYDRLCGQLRDWIIRCQILCLGKQAKYLSLIFKQLYPRVFGWKHSNSSNSTSPYFYIGGFVAAYLSKMAATIVGSSLFHTCMLTRIRSHVAVAWRCFRWRWTSSPSREKLESASYITNTHCIIVFASSRPSVSKTRDNIHRYQYNNLIICLISVFGIRFCKKKMFARRNFCYSSNIGDN